MQSEAIVIVTATGRTVKMTPDDIQRFWNHVWKDGPISEHLPDAGPCWIWAGERRKSGHGMWRPRGTRIAIYAHRTAFRLHYGHLPERPKQVNHGCQRSECVNPAHLYAGTAKENTGDALRAGRVRMGDSHPTSKLTSEDVWEIRRMADSRKIPQKQIAVMFNVSLHEVAAISTRRLWAHLHESEDSVYDKSKNRLAKKLTEEQVIEIRRLRATREMSLDKVGKMFGVRSNYIYRIEKREVWNKI